MEKKITYAIPFLVLMFIMLLTGNQQAFAGLEDCQKCHGTVISDFAVEPLLQQRLVKPAIKVF